MIDAPQLLADLKPLLRTLEQDLLERSESDEVPEVGRRLRAEHLEAKRIERTAQSYEEWRADYATQVAAAWVLSGVFVRFLEDNRLIDPPKLSGAGGRRQRAHDEHEVYFRAHPTETDREYLLTVFDDLARLPGAEEVFGGHNPLRDLPSWLSGDAAGNLLQFFQKIDPATGALRHDFTDPNWNTRFLGDLYQDLSEAARKKYALLQTPEFVEEFILSRTLDPALGEFGLDGFRMIDPACGSGHFLLGSFARLLDRWQHKEPGTNVRALAQRALDSIHGVDLNPYAVAIARFRLLLAAMRSCGITRLADAPDFHLSLACGDSLLHEGQLELALDGAGEEQHAYPSEDLSLLKGILLPRRYHAVVANPPYITPKDRALSERYRQRFRTCHMKYSLSVPFMERIFGLATEGGFTGQITSNSFMKREFGRKLIEEFFPKVDLTHVIDTGGAYIPGHGTPTVILFGRNRRPVSSTIRTVLGIRGEPTAPENPAEARVWSAIRAQADQPGSRSAFVSSADSLREQFHRHPWSIGGGGAAELKTRIDDARAKTLDKVAASVGITAVTGEDEVFVQPLQTLRRRRIEQIKLLVEGDIVRDWRVGPALSSVWLYGEDYALIRLESLPQTYRMFWQWRAAINRRRRFGIPMVERGLTWYEWQELYRSKFRWPLSIAFGEIATHNHFALDGGGKVFKHTAPIIKLPKDTDRSGHLQVLGVLNSSIACFWLRQVCFPKGGDHVGQEGARVSRIRWEERFAFNSANVEQFPLPARLPLEPARRLDALGCRLRNLSPAESVTGHNGVKIVAELPVRQDEWERTREEMIALQEELDWQCYRLYSLLDEELTHHEEPPPIRLGQRAFEIVMARKVVAGELETTWFDRHRAMPITEIPVEWPEEYRRLVERRIELIEKDPNIRLIEQPEYKRRWNTEPWEHQLKRALRIWLLDRLESYFDLDGRMNDAGIPTARLDIALVSTARLSDLAGKDEEFMRVAELYRDDPAFDLRRLVDELVQDESVPLLPVMRYKDTGLRKRAEWERTWELQRQEDALERELRQEFTRDTKPPEPDTLISWTEAQRHPAARLAFHEGDEEAARLLRPAVPSLPFRELVRLAQKYGLGDIPVPPKYTGADFLESRYWRLRGKLDVAKERWVCFPHCEGSDGAPLITWAGYDHLQLAQAVSALFVDVQERLGGREDPRLAPLLACLVELLPWLKQWHNDVHPEYGVGMGDYFEGFLLDEARQMGRTPEEIRAWTPPQRPGRGRGRGG